MNEDNKSSFNWAETIIYIILFLWASSSISDLSSRLDSIEVQLDQIESTLDDIKFELKYK